MCAVEEICDLMCMYKNKGMDSLFIIYIIDFALTPNPYI